MDTNKLTRIAMLSCLSFVGRMMFSFIPNVQPTTVIILIITLYFGVTEGILVSIISIMMSNLYLGMGIWTMAQIVSYSMVVIFFYVMTKLIPVKSDIYYSMLALVSGLVYGFFISLVQAPFFGWNVFIPYYISGIPFDISHAVGNFLFFLILHPALKTVLTKNI